MNLPGSPKAAGEALDVVLPVLPHAIELLAGDADRRMNFMDFARRKRICSERSTKRLRAASRTVSIACARFCASSAIRKNDIRRVHIGGTSGKGSTSTMVAAALDGIRANASGLHTKPHLRSMAERARIDGVPVSEERFAESADRMMPAIESVTSRTFAGRRITKRCSRSRSLHFRAASGSTSR